MRKEIRAAVKWAEASPAPDETKDLYTDVYVERWGPYLGTSPPEMLEGGE